MAEVSGTSSSGRLRRISVVRNPRQPQLIFTKTGMIYHGLRVSDDGRTLYAADMGSPGPAGLGGAGLAILDVSQIQDRRAKPKAPILSKLEWRNVSIPQVAEPFTSEGRHYLLEVDEFIDLVTFDGLANLNQASVGAARIIDVEDPKHPSVVSDIRLEVHQPEQRSGPQKDDPQASNPVQGYSAHYCGLPTQVNPKIAGCSMILSGLRLFDIRDVEHPKEVAYFNQPASSPTLPAQSGPQGSYALSQPAWDRKGRSVWFTDANSGFYAVKLTNGVGKLLR